MTEDEPTTTTGEPESEYSGPQANGGEDGYVYVDFKFESYKLDPDTSENLGNQLKAAAEDAREHGN